MKERIQKILGNAGIASRRNIEEMVRDGRVAVNGKVVRELPILVDPEKDQIAVDDENVKFNSRRGGPSGGERIYLLMNKPRGVYSTNVAQGVQTRAIDLLPEDFPRVYPVGQLDAESRGLLLLTNDGDLTNKLTHPRYGVPKTYRAIIDGEVSPQLVEELEGGVWMADRQTGKGFKTGRSQIKIVHRERDRTVLDITIREGRNHQIRRVLAKLGYKLRDLTRVKIGPLTLDRIAPGKYRPLTPKEVRQLREVAERKENAASRPERSTRAPRGPADRRTRPPKPAGRAHAEARRRG